jgi:hypothetical protein
MCTATLCSGRQSYSRVRVSGMSCNVSLVWDTDDTETGLNQNKTRSTEFSAHTHTSTDTIFHPYPLCIFGY